MLNKEVIRVFHVSSSIIPRHATPPTRGNNTWSFQIQLTVCSGSIRPSSTVYVDSQANRVCSKLRCIRVWFGSDCRFRMDKRRCERYTPCCIQGNMYSSLWICTPKMIWNTVITVYGFFIVPGQTRIPCIVLCDQSIRDNKAPFKICEENR